MVTGRAYRKNLWRSIRKSLGRYLAIMAIVALGVGFFAGLKVTKQAMIRTGDDYLRQTGFYDFRLLSTLGLTEEDVQAYRETDGIGAAEGSFSADFLYDGDDGDYGVLKAHLLPDDINAAMDAQWSEMKSYEDGGSGWMVLALLLLAIAISAFNIWRKLRKKSRDNY